MDEKIPFCPPGLISYLNFYHVEIHFYISFPICIIGLITNAMTATIFTRRTLASSRNASNLIFTCLAVTYLIFFIVYAFGATYLYPNLSTKVKYSYGFALASLIALHITYLSESITTWLTIVLAAVRCIAVIYPHRSFDWLKMKNIRRSITVICVLCLLFQIPLMLLIKVNHGTTALDDTDDDETSSTNGSSTVIKANTTLIDGYLVEWIDDITTSNLLMDVNFIIYVVIIKFIPSVVLAVLSVR